MKLSELKEAEKNIEEFCETFGTVISITNAKGIWTARMTRKAVQIFYKTGSSLLDVYMTASDVCVEKRSSLGV